MESEICAKPYQNYIDGNGINSGRVVLHSDMNNFFASVECMLKPELTAFPVALSCLVSLRQCAFRPRECSLRDIS